MTHASEQMLAHLVLEVAKLTSDMQKFRDEVAAFQRGLPLPASFWHPTSEAVDLLKPEGIRSSKELLVLVRIGVLPVDNEHVRNVGMGNKRPTYEFRPEACLKPINWWKGLEPIQRKEFIARSKEIPDT